MHINMDTHWRLCTVHKNFRDTDSRFKAIGIVLSTTRPRSGTNLKPKGNQVLLLIYLQKMVSGVCWDNLFYNGYLLVYCRCICKGSV